MKKIFLFFAAVICSYAANSQSVGIETTQPHASAVLELQSNSKGLLISG